MSRNQNDFYHEGAEDWQAAGPDATNPYNPDTLYGQEWQRGYDEERTQELGPGR